MGGKIQILLLQIQLHSKWESLMATKRNKIEIEFSCPVSQNTVREKQFSKGGWLKYVWLVLSFNKTCLKKNQTLGKHRT